MTYRFTSRSGIAVERGAPALDDSDRLDDLVGRLDHERGAYFSSGVEYPDRYSRWDFGFTSPPLELVSLGPTLSVNALNGRGEVILELLVPLLTGGDDVEVEAREAGTLRLAVRSSERPFAEEERSLQPSVFGPLKRLIEDFAGIEDSFLGLFGAFGHDLIFQFDPIALRLDRSGVPKDMHLFLPDRIHVIDRRLGTAHRFDFDFSKGKVGTAGLARDKVPAAPAPAAKVAPAQRDIASDQTDEEYAAKVDSARARMVAGDVFELVLSRRFSAPCDRAPSALFRQMREINPSPYEFLIQFGDEQLIGASPEMFIRVEGDRVESSPIAGTVRRGDNAMQDAEHIRDLYNSAKDEAELTMCTDVDRNDKARVCVPGSVRLLRRRLIERYAGLFHTVDHVEGRLRPGFGGIDAFLSHMWAVTLTGAPKRMAVNLIEEMEEEPRRWYGGAVGALGLNGGVNTGITIRTIHLEGGQANYRAGASLVYDSVGADEARETHTKATPFFRLLGTRAEARAKPGAGLENVGAGRTIIMIDNEDSFVHTLADYFRQTGAEVRTYRTGGPVERIIESGPDLVVHSPGPGRPAQFGVPALVRELAGAGVPQFGVCLGLQGIAEAFGGELGVLDEPRHGKIWDVRHGRSGLFAGLPSPCRVGAYHSLYARRESLPDILEVTGWNDSGTVMALRHRELPIAAVQFHPESILSMDDDLGLRLVANVVVALTGGTEFAKS